MTFAHYRKDHPANSTYPLAALKLLSRSPAPEKPSIPGLS